MWNSGDVPGDKIGDDNLDDLLGSPTARDGGVVQLPGEASLEHNLRILAPVRYQIRWRRAQSLQR